MAEPLMGRVVGPLIGWLTTEEGLPLRWLRWDASAPLGSVLVIHGFGDHGGRYRDVARVLGERGFTVAAYDQRGHGESGGRRGDTPRFEAFLDDLDRAWAEAERTLPPPLFLYGHSFGALVAIRWIQTRAVRPRGVVLSAPWFALRMPVPAWKRAAASVLLRLAPGLTIASGSDRPEFLTRDPVRGAEYVADPLAHHLISARFHAAIVEAQAQALATPWPDLWAMLVVPGDDPLVDAQVALDWQPRHPRISVLVREGGRHELHNDLDRDQALSAIGAWLEQRLAAEPAPPRRVPTRGPTEPIP